MMNFTSETVVIDDDEDVEIIDDSVRGNTEKANPLQIGEGSGDRVENSGAAPKKLVHIRSKNNMPSEKNGYTRPSYNYCRLITQALVTIPERKATSKQICDMIAKKHPYYEHLNEFNWRGSIHGALRTRKKFFTVVGTDEKMELIWSFNPTFEQFMLDKWVPKYVQKKSLSSSIQNYIPWLPKGHAQQFSPSVSTQNSVMVASQNTSPITASSESPSPVIVFSGSLLSGSSSVSSIADFDTASANPVTNEILAEDPLRPEDSLQDPMPIIESVSSIENNFKPWEPEVTVNDNLPDSTSKLTSILTEALEEKSPSTDASISSYNITKNDDFSMDNLNVKHVILREEILYRVNFNKEHRAIEKFRLHCTVCDDHLGTSGSVCRRKVRLHPVLGVLVCIKCYEKTSNPTSLACLWCAKANSVARVCCIQCTNIVCQICMERNFGQSWCATVMDQRDWTCFQCDTKQIWPHRAIAYFFFRHYRDISRKKDHLSKHKVLPPRELRFFIQDLSTCCKTGATRERQAPATLTVPTSSAPAASMASVLSSSFIPPMVSHTPLISTSTTPATTAVTSRPPLFVIGEQSPNYIYVQTPSSVPSVTLNTGTQYIHNVYPDKNYVLVDNTVESRPNPTVNTSTSANTIVYTQSPHAAPRFPVAMPKNHTESNLSLVPGDESRPAYPLPISPPPPYSAIGVEVTPSRHLSNDKIPEPVLNFSIEANGSGTTSKTVDKNNLKITVTSTSEIFGVDPEESVIIPDVVPPQESKTMQKNVIAEPVLSTRERIERRPMPKSKKQSLLRTVLMSESIESMKRHLQLQAEPNISTENNTLSAHVEKPRDESGQNVEEPILRSIIETATERLLNLQKNQNNYSSSNTEETRPVASVNLPSETFIDLCENENSPSQAECKITESPVIVPKIKIKTLKELQDPKVFNFNHNNQEGLSQTNEEGVNKEFDTTNQQYQFENQGLDKENVTEEAEINITDLKQGIIEASRTLINTQKQFKELAKIISSNLIYKPDQAFELITKFHDILKVCHQELDQIDVNVKHQFGHLISSTNIDSVLQLMKKTTEGVNPNASHVIRKKRKKSLGKRKSQGTILRDNIVQNTYNSTGEFEENQTDSPINSIENNEINLQSSIRSKRTLVGFNPLGKKVILGSPDITEDDLKRIPNTWDPLAEGSNQNSSPSHNEVYMEELRRRQYLARKEAWKKKNIWLTSKRKKRKYKKRSLQPNDSASLVYNEEGSLMKKRPYKKRKKMFNSDDDEDETYKPPSFYPTFVRRSVKSSRPLRLSARKHPSTVAHVSQLISFEQSDLTLTIKPCSVVLERLDPTMMQVLAKTAVDLRESDEIENITEIQNIGFDEA